MLGTGDSDVELESELALEEEDLLDSFFSLGTTAAPVIKFSLSPSLVTPRGLSTDARGEGSGNNLSEITKYENKTTTIAM